MSIFPIILGGSEYHHNRWKKLLDWRVIAVPSQPSSLKYHILFGGDTAESIAEVKTWTAEGLNLLIETLPDSGRLEAWKFYLQVARRTPGRSVWENLSQLYPLSKEDCFNVSHELRTLQNDYESRWKDDSEARQMLQQAREMSLDILAVAREGRPTSQTETHFSNI